MKKAEGRRQKAEGRRRIVGLDFVKGVTIFLVVFGHCIQYGNGQEYSQSGAFFDDIIFKIIYSFHMPLFALVSGYLFFWSVSSRSPREVLIRQANNLILPALSWTVIFQSAKALLQVYRGNFVGIMAMLWNALKSFLYGLWFLWAMLFASLIVLLAREKFRDSVKFYVLVLMMLMFMPGRVIPATHVFVYPYFVAGYLWHRDGMDEKFTFSTLFCAGVIALWCIMLMFYGHDSYVYTTGTVLIKYRQGVFVPEQILTDVFRWIIGFAGCGSVLILLKLVRPVNFLAAIGSKSLGIYIISGYLMRYLPEHGGYVVNFLEAAAITAGCYALSVMISRVKSLNRLLFGGR